MRQRYPSFKPVLVALGVVKFQSAWAIPARNLGGAPALKTALTNRLYTAQEVTSLGYDVPALLARFECERMHGDLGMHRCQFCTSVWGVTYEHDYRDAYREEEAPRVWCCGRCFAKVLQAPWAASPYALYGKGPRWADTKPGASPWDGRPMW
jgi:hypothetical protein